MNAPPPPPPFIMPPPRKVENNNSNDNSVDNNNCNIKNPYCVCFIFVFLALVGFMVYTSRSADTFDFKPEYQIDSVGVTSMKVVYNVGDNKPHLMMADLDFNLTMNRRVKGHLTFRGQILFNPVEVSLQAEGYHQDELLLSSTRLDPYFLMENQHQHQLQFGMQINNKTVEDSMSSSRDLSVVQFALKGRGGCVNWFGVGAVKNCSINFLCDDIELRILPANNSTTQSMSMIVSPLPIPCKCDFDCHRS